MSKASKWSSVTAFLTLFAAYNVMKDAYEASLYVLQIIGSGSPMELMSDCSYMCKHQNYDSRFLQRDEETTCGFFNLEVGKIQYLILVRALDIVSISEIKFTD